MTKDDRSTDKMEENNEYMEDEYREKFIEKNKNHIIDNLNDLDIQRLKEKFIDDDLMMSLMINSNYREITFERDIKDCLYLKCVLEYFPDNIKLVDLMKKHPFSDIKTVIHRGIIKKYTIIEKVKIDK